MPYCTLTDLQGVMSDSELIQLTDDSVPPISIGQNNVDQAILRAGNLLDGYLRGRYVLPLSPVPGIMTNLAVDVAVYNLYKRKKKGAFPQAVADDYKNTLKLLENIQKGLIDIGSTRITVADTTGATSSGGGGMVSAPGRKCTGGSLSDM
jgi:phage gp36-like protein